MELKKRFKYRLILDESWSFGIVGKTGRGVTEVFGIPAAQVDIITGSMANGLCSAGGFCAGSTEVVAHQRINSPGFVFSAALPPLLAVAASEVISMLSIPSNNTSPAHPLQQLPTNVSTLRQILSTVQGIEIPSAEISPLIHITIPNANSTDVTSFFPSNPADTQSQREEEEQKLQEVVDLCAENGVLVSRTKRNWQQEMVENKPSIRVCVSAGLNKKEIEKAGNVLKTSLVKVLGKQGKKGK